MAGKEINRKAHSQMMKILTASNHFRLGLLLLFLPVNSVLAETQNTPSDHSRIHSEEGARRDSANPLSTTDALSPEASIEQNNQNTTDTSTNVSAQQNAPIQPDEAKSEAEIAEELRCQTDFNVWKSCVQLKIRRFARLERNTEETAGGQVNIRFNYDEEGKIIETIVLKSSGDEKLDKRAVALFERIATIPKPIMGKGSLTVPIKFVKVEKKQAEDGPLDDKATKEAPLPN